MRRGWAVIAVLLILLAVLTGGALLARELLNNWLTPDTRAGQAGSPGQFNVLLLGSDARPGQRVGNTDTIIVAQLDSARISLLSIPRDTQVTIPGHGTGKINSACRYGGPQLTAEVVSDLIGIPVQKYVLVRWSGFIKIVDALGGVNLYVPRNMHYDPQDGPQYRINLHAGRQHLNGQQALAFVRFRHEVRGDIDRTEQQLAFMKAMAEQIKQPGTLLKLPVLIPELYQNVDTNLGMGEVLALARAGYDLKNMTVVTQTLPGYFFNQNGLSYWGVEPEKARLVARYLFQYGVTTRQVVLETPHYLRRSQPIPTPRTTKPLEIDLNQPTPPATTPGESPPDNQVTPPEPGNNGGTEIPGGNPDHPENGGIPNPQPPGPPLGGDGSAPAPQQPIN